MTGTWCQTQDGQHVYVQDDGSGWYWSHADQGWYCDPDLMIQVPTAPLSARLGSEAKRLRHGWPSFWKIFDVRHHEGFWYRSQSILFIVAMLWMWVWKVGIDYGIHNVARAWQKEVYGFWATHDGGVSGYGTWYREGVDTDQHARYIMFVILFFVITLGILYSMYVGVATAADPHKGMLLLVPVVATVAVHEHQRRQRRHDQRFAQDIAGALDRRHHGGSGGGSR